MNNTKANVLLYIHPHKYKVPYIRLSKCCISATRRSVYLGFICPDSRDVAGYDRCLSHPHQLKMYSSTPITTQLCNMSLTTIYQKSGHGLLRLHYGALLVWFLSHAYLNVGSSINHARIPLSSLSIGSLKLQNTTTLIFFTPKYTTSPTCYHLKWIFIHSKWQSSKSTYQCYC